MAQQDPIDRLGTLAQHEGQRRLLWWGIGAGFGCLGPAFLILVAVLTGVVLLAGVGQWFSGFFGPSPPPIATPLSRPAEWLVLATQDAEIDQGIPNVVVMAVIAQASGGQAYGDRYYCSNGQSAGEPCRTAYHPGVLGLGAHGVRTLGIGYGLMGLNNQDIHLPPGQTWHNTAWNLATGIRALAGSLRSTPYWHNALLAFHYAVQTPASWQHSTSYATSIDALMQAYESGPQMGAWALAPWSSKTGQFTDPGNTPEWVLVVATAPTGAPFAHAWKPPTTTCIPAPPHSSKPPTCHVTPHLLSGRDLAPPIAVTGTLANGQSVTFTGSAANTQVPVWSGGSVLGAEVPLTGPGALTQLTAAWPNGMRFTIPWPEQSGGVVGTLAHIPPSQAIQQWWPDILVASQDSGTPADWIAAAMLNESGGIANAGNLAGAYGLMQLEPGTIGATDAARANPQENLILGAQYLAELHDEWGSWRIASAAYYGGTGSVTQDGVTPGMPWGVAGTDLRTVPFAGAGNTLTMAAYANNIDATSHAIAQMPQK